MIDGLFVYSNQVRRCLLVQRQLHNANVFFIFKNGQKEAALIETYFL